MVILLMLPKIGIIILNWNGKKEFTISNPESRIRQIIKYFGYRKITCGPRSKRRNEALTNEFMAET